MYRYFSYYLAQVRAGLTEPKANYKHTLWGQMGMHEVTPSVKRAVLQLVKELTLSQGP